MSKEVKNNVKILETDYAKEQYAKYAYQQRQIIFRRRRLMAVFIVAFVIFLSVGISLFNDYLRLQQLQDVKQETIVKQAEVKQKMADLNRDVALLKDDDYVAKVARSRFLYSKEGELIFPLPGNEAAEKADDSTTESSE
ncbi:MAG TPA: septum formation initiator family protein [Enterococcus sp.]|nr:septum formation initiator family protein [Enterococcus sp.]HPR81814.1 septum formation initiator family protein [Enterococcus sp.]